MYVALFRKKFIPSTAGDMNGKFNSLPSCPHKSTSSETQHISIYKQQNPIIYNDNFSITFFQIKLTPAVNCVKP